MKIKYVGYMSLWNIQKKYWHKEFLPPFKVENYAYDVYQIKIPFYVFFVEISYKTITGDK